MQTEIEIEIISHLAELFKCKKEAVLIVKRLLGGMSHYTYLTSVKGVLYTYRKIGPAGNLYVNRNDELANMKLIEKLEVNNETYFFDTKTGVKVAKYVEGIVLTETDYKQHITKIVDVLKKVHQSGIKATVDFNPIERLIKYESFNVTQDPLYLELKKRFLALYHLYYENRPKVLCHNDAQRSNMVLSTIDKLYLLDWEYVGNNDFYYDIASFGNVDFNDSVILLSHYLEKEPTKEEIDHIRFYRMFQALMWHQVAKYKDLIGLSSKLKIDFNHYQSHYLKLAERLYEEIMSD